eukprot:4371000-Prymnesium_polylepis.1
MLLGTPSAELAEAARELERGKRTNRVANDLFFKGACDLRRRLQCPLAPSDVVVALMLEWWRRARLRQARSIRSMRHLRSSGASRAPIAGGSRRAAARRGCVDAPRAFCSARGWSPCPRRTPCAAPAATPRPPREIALRDAAPAGPSTAGPAPASGSTQPFGRRLRRRRGRRRALCSTRQRSGSSPS